MSTWNYRVLRHPHGGLQMHEVYYDDTGKPVGFTGIAQEYASQDDEDPESDVVAMMQRDWRLQLAAFEKPILPLNESGDNFAWGELPEGKFDDDN